MDFDICEDGFVFKKLLSSRVVPFGDVKLIQVNENDTVFTTRDGEEIKFKGSWFRSGVKPEFFDAIKKHNFAYRNEYELSNTKALYTAKEARPFFANVMAKARDFIGREYKARLGDDMDIEMLIHEEGENFFLCYRLVRGGEVVTDIPDGTRDDLYANVPGCFDSIVLAFLCEWDTGSCEGRYGLTLELTDDKALEECFYYSFENLDSILYLWNK